MTDDLTARLERALHVQEQHERDLQPDAATLADLHARVARTRRGRTASYAAVAAAAVGVLGVAGWFGLQDRTAPEPAHTPTPTVTVTPSPSPSSEPSDAAGAPLEPGGDLRVGTLDLRTGGIAFDERVPGSAMWVGAAGDDEVWLTGARWDEPRSGVLHVVPPAGPSRDVLTDLGWAYLSPDGRTVVGRGADEKVVAVDLATGRHSAVQVPAGQFCDVITWLDATGVMATCVDRLPPDFVGRWNYDEHGGQVVRLDAAGGAFRTLTTVRADSVVPTGGEYVRDGVVVSNAAPVLSSTDPGCFDLCFGGAYLWTGGDVRPVTPQPDLGGEVCEVRAARSGLLLRSGVQCYEWPGDRWWLTDEATGASRELAPGGDGEGRLVAQTLVERS